MFPIHINVVVITSRFPAWFPSPDLISVSEDIPSSVSFSMLDLLEAILIHNDTLSFFKITFLLDRWELIIALEWSFPFLKVLAILNFVFLAKAWSASNGKAIVIYNDYLRW